MRGTTLSCDGCGVTFDEPYDEVKFASDGVTANPSKGLYDYKIHVCSQKCKKDVEAERKLTGGKTHWVKM